jgi:hypothetical protein
MVIWLSYLQKAGMGQIGQPRHQLLTYLQDYRVCGESDKESCSARMDRYRWRGRSSPTLSDGLTLFAYTRHQL